MTLSEYQAMLGNTIRMNPALQGAWVVAELSDVRVAGGHCYMELIEKDAAGTTRAKLRAMIWSGTLQTLRGKFLAATGQDIRTGLKVMLRGSANHHSVYGLSFTISDIDPSYTLGDLERLRREILERLKKEGILDHNRRLQMPVAPQRIAVISAAGAAGYGDFVNQLESTPEGYKFYPMLFQAVMQGDRTSASVRSALDLIESTVDMWDCAVIIRGGGATSDLNGFDDYALAARLATFSLPVVVGIGHERDRTVLDEIACVRCKTPTAVAAYLIDALRNAWQMTYDRVDRIARYASDRLRGEEMRLANIEGMLPAKVTTRIMREERRLGEYSGRLERSLGVRKMNADAQLGMLSLRLENVMKNITERPMLRLRNLENMLRVLSPENTLRRGYSVTRVNGKAVRDADELKPGDEIVTTLYQGEIRSHITE